MGVIRYKIWQDLWRNKSRTMQVVAIIAIGAFAVGMIMGGRNLVQARMSESWRASTPAMIYLAVKPAVDDTMITSLRNLKGIEDAEGYLETNLEWRFSPDEPWQQGRLIARADYEDQRYNKLHLLDGQWPLNKGFAVERGNDTFFGLKPGVKIYIRLNNREYITSIEGMVNNLTVLPPAFGSNAQFYASRDRFGDLTGQRDFNRILAGASHYDRQEINIIADRVQSRSEKQNIEVTAAAPPEGESNRVTDPNKHFFNTVLDGLFLVLGVMAGLSLLLGLILVYNTINAVISEQVQQIGVMKAIGASVGQILQIYLINVLVYGILAWLVAAPLGALGAYGLAYFLVDAFNTEPGPFAVSAQAILAQAALALLLPLLVALGPVFAGARITVREAINTYGLGATSGLLECLLARFQSVSRLLLLTLSNAFRNKGRVVLTQMALVGSGLIFMMVISVSNSVAYTYGELLFSILSFDVNLQFETPERIEAIEGLTQAYPGVKHVELWGASVAKTRPVYRPEANDDKNAQLFGLPIPTALYHPQLRAGRWLEPADRHAVVLNQKLADRIGVKVGDRIVFDFGVYGESNWQVVGLLFDPIFPHSAYVPRETLLREIRSVHRATTVWVQAESGDAAAEVTLAQGLRTFYDRRKIKVTAQPIYFKDTASQLTEQILSNFSVVISLLEVVAVVIGLVGAVALSGILSLGVLERRREIGVMRAVGASSATIAMMFIGEGLFMGWLSWLVALPLSIPAGYLFTWVLGIALDGEMIYVYDPLGGVYWLLIITILSVLASWFPARSATQISVRESLAYQ